MTSRTTAAVVVLTTAGGLLTALTAPASAAVTCASPVFKRQYYANTTLTGTPVKTNCDSAVAESWGSGAPASGLPSNNFSVRWTVTRDFGSGGPFTFSAATQDGIRVYLDGVRRIDLWRNVSSTVSKTVNVTIPSGKHTLRVDYVNWTGNANVKFAYTPRTSATVDKVRPLVPTGLTTSYDRTTGKATLTWARNKEMDLAGYRVYRRLDGQPFGSVPLATTTATSYTDATLPKNGSTYFYEVRAYDRAGNVSGGSADWAVTTVDRTAPAQVTGVEGKGTTSGNTLTWQPSSADVEYYEVWGAPVGQSDPDGPEIALDTSFTDVTAEAGTAYSYVIQALDGAGNISRSSAPVTVTRPAPSAVPAPENLEATAYDDRTEVRWTPVPSGDGRYTVYRRTVYGGWIGIGTTRDTVWQDTLAPESKSTYAVVALDASGAESVPSLPYSVNRVTPATATAPQPPRLRLDSTGVPGRSPVQVTSYIAAADEGRLLRGFSWEFSGACGDSGAQMSPNQVIEWVAPYNGPCMVTVRGVDWYGRVGEAASLEFFSGR